MAGIASGVTRIAGDDIALVARNMFQGSLDSSPLMGKAVEVVGDVISGSGFTSDGLSIVAAGARDQGHALPRLALMDSPQGLIDLVKASNGRLANVTLEGALAIQNPGSRSAVAGVQVSRVVSPHIQTPAEQLAAEAAQDASRLDELFGSGGRGTALPQERLTMNTEAWGIQPDRGYLTRG